MKPLFSGLLVSAFVLFACHKSTHKTPVNPAPSSQWRWTNLTVPIASGVGNWQPASDSVVILSLDDDSTFNIRINDSLASAGHYRVTPDSLQMIFSISAPIYPNGLRLCSDCGLTFSNDRDTLSLRLPLSNPTNIGLFTFVRLRE